MSSDNMNRKAENICCCNWSWNTIDGLRYAGGKIITFFRMNKILCFILLMFFSVYGWKTYAEDCVKPVINNKPFSKRRAEMLNVDDRLKPYRQQWMDATKGKNIALGAKVRFSWNPNYKHTKSDSDKWDIVDGKLITRKDGKLLFDKNAVAWAGHGIRTKGVAIIIDLLKVQPIDKIIVRVMGGGGFTSTWFPKEMTVLVSKDMKNFYQVAQINKVPETDSIAPHGIIKAGTLYLNENNKSYVFPYEFKDLHTKARYVVIIAKVLRYGFFGCDEIAIIKGNDDLEKISYDPSKKKYYSIDGIGFYPDKISLDISENINIPNYFRVDDNRNSPQKPVTFVIELPPEIEIKQGKFSGKIKKEKAENSIRWKISKPHMTGSFAGPFNFKLLKKTLSSNTAIFYAEAEGSKPNKQHVPIRIVNIPEVPAYKHFHFDSGWMTHKYMLDWPDCLKAMKHLGFNAISYFPRNWVGKRDEAEILKHIKNARKADFKITYMESPFHMMHSINRKETDVAQIYSVYTDGRKEKQAHNRICPSYFGKYYAKELKRVGDMAELVMPDVIMFDIECFSYTAKMIGKCKTCIDKKKQTGIKTDEKFIEYLGMVHARDLYNEIKKRSNKLSMPTPLMGAYRVYAKNNHSGQVFNYNKLSPKYLQLSQSNLYVGGDVKIVRNTIKEDYSIQKKRASIPWITAGTSGEFPSKRIEPMIYEIILNGASGFVYFINTNWDTPMDLYYQAVALKNLYPYENMLFSGGAPIELPCSNKRIKISAWKNGKETIILAANYLTNSKENAIITLPTAKIAELKDIRHNKKLTSSKTISCSLGYYDCALYYIKEK